MISSVRSPAPGPRRASDRDDVVDEVGVGELAGRDVDRDRRWSRGGGVCQHARVAARLPQHLTADVDDQAGVLGRAG